MSSDLEHRPNQGVDRIRHVDLSVLDEMVAAVTDEARSPATRKAYAADWRRYRAWCDLHDLDHQLVDVETVRRFLTAEAAEGYALSTLHRRAGSLSAIARRNGQPSLYADPAFGEFLDGLDHLAAANGQSEQRQATALTIERLADVLATVDPDTRKGRRDRAILLAGFGGLLRRSETAALTRADVTTTAYGLDLRIRRSKTNRSGRPEWAPLARLKDRELCPVVAVNAWLSATAEQPSPAPLFHRLTRGGRTVYNNDGQVVAMDGDSINAVIQTRAATIAEPGDNFSGHSLRRGGATSRSQRGATLLQLERAGRWAPGSPEVRKYVEEANRAIEAGAHLLDLPLPTIEHEAV